MGGMTGAELCDMLKEQLVLANDAALADALQLTSGRISQIRSQEEELKPKQIAKLFEKSLEHRIGKEFTSAVKPIVEFFPVALTQTSHKKKFVPFDVKKNETLHEKLKISHGIYAFYNSEGELIYLGKAKIQNLFSELKDAFNRFFPSYQILGVDHGDGKYSESDTGQKQIRKLQGRLYDTAHYFSCYNVEPDLINPLEALLIRIAPNNLINVRMEKLGRK